MLSSVPYTPHSTFTHHASRITHHAPRGPMATETGEPPVRAAVIGVGAMGRNHARVYNEIEAAQLVAVADAAPATAERAGRLFHAPFYTYVERLLDEARPEVVSLAVPTLLHLPVARQVLRRGVH